MLSLLHWRLNMSSFFNLFLLFVRSFVHIFMTYHAVNAKNVTIYIFFVLITYSSILHLNIYYLFLLSLISGINDYHCVIMTSNKSHSNNESVKEKDDCIYERLRSAVNRVGSTCIGTNSHVFFVFGASVC